MDKKIRNLTYIGLVTALIAVISVWQIPIPFSGVALTFQTFAVSLSGYMLKGWRGVLCVLLYIVLGAVGLPVFSGFQGGAFVLLGPSGGFIFGFLPLALLCGIKKARKPFISLALGLLGLILCHLFGVIQLCLVTKSAPLTAFLASSLPFIPKDILSLLGAYLISRMLGKRLLKNK